MRARSVVLAAVFGAIGATAGAREPRTGQASPAGSFRDHQNRFEVALPPGWRFNPAVTDLNGAMFVGEHGGKIAQAQVRVATFPQAVSLQQFAASILSGFDQEPGFQVRKPSTPATIARRDGIERSFLLRGPPGTHQLRVVEQRLLFDGPPGHSAPEGHVGYVLHCEALEGAFASFQGDCARLFAGFRPQNDLLSSGRRVVQAHHLLAGDLVGRWKGGGHILSMSPSGQIDLDGREGTWRLDLGALVLSFEAQDTVFEVELRDKSLFLRGGSFGDGQAFTRAPIPGHT